MATFGNTSASTSLSDGIYANSKLSTKAVLTETGLVSKLSFYCWNSSANVIGIRSGIYTNHASNYPLNLVSGTNATANMAANQSLGWMDITFGTPVSLDAGTYWLALQADANGDNAIVYYLSQAASGAWIADTYSDGIASTWGGTTTNSVYAQIYATYTVPVAGFTGLTVTRLLQG